jgi:hypothetical protein
MEKQFYFQLSVTDEQIHYAKQLVEYSMANHKVPNIWDGTLQQHKTIDLRFTGSLGEVVFADTYQLERPIRAFGATDGQDWGKDFELEIDGKYQNFDIKTMRRKSNVFYTDYVLNIPANQLKRANSLTHYYFHISLHEQSPNNFIASFIGYVNKIAIIEQKIGKLYLANTTRTRGNGTSFTFLKDTYEIDFKDFCPPPQNQKIENRTDYLKREIRTKK